MNCKNCGEVVSSNFCGNCGQSASVSKITLPKLLNQLSESIFLFNNGLLYTLKELFVRPGISIQDFLNGKRKRHFKPIAYVLFFSTVYFLASKITGQNTLIDDMITGFSNGANASDGKLQLPTYVSWLANNYAYTTLLLIPIFSFASYISFSRFDPNYLEHIVLNCYITGQQAILYSLFSLIIIVIDHPVAESIPLLIAVTYNFWVFAQFFKEGNRKVNILRSILTYVLFLIFGFISFLLLMGVHEL
jgi:hypothetical protein